MSGRGGDRPDPNERDLEPEFGDSEPADAIDESERPQVNPDPDAPDED